MTAMDDRLITCSFCGVNNKMVRHMVEGDQAAICDKCLAVSCQLILDHEKKVRDAGRFDREALLIQAPGGV